MTKNIDVQQIILEKLHHLSSHKQQELLDFADFLLQKSTPKPKRRSIKGLWANLDIQITDADITEARREMWGNFLRDNI